MKYCIALLPRHIKKAIECSLIFFSLNSFLLINMFLPNCFKWKIQQLGRSKPRSKCQVFVFPAVRRAALTKMTRLPLGTIAASKQWTHVKAQRRVGDVTDGVKTFRFIPKENNDSYGSHCIATCQSCSLIFRLKLRQPRSRACIGFFACLFTFCVPLYPELQGSL